MLFVVSDPLCSGWLIGELHNCMAWIKVEEKKQE